MWNKIGGVIGVVAILALVVAVVQLVQSNNAAKVQDLAQTTQIAILEQQLDVNREMATLQANISKSGPTAMAVATRMAELESTAVALAMAQTSAKATTPVSPSSVSIPAGGSFLPTAGWTWICGGDFSVTRPDGQTVVLHDNAEPGLIIVLEPDSQVIVNAPWGGYCEPFVSKEIDNGLLKFITDGFAKGCDNGCSSINVRELNPTGNIVKDYWVKP